MCLVRALNIGVDARKVAPKLSHQRIGGKGGIVCNSARMNFTQMILALARAMLLYSASVPDQATICCFLELHDTRFDPRKIQKPEVERRSSRQPAQSESDVIVSCWLLEVLNHMLGSQPNI
jgi:hypothetical protein